MVQQAAEAAKFAMQPLELSAEPTTVMPNGSGAAPSRAAVAFIPAALDHTRVTMAATQAAATKTTATGVAMTATQAAASRTAVTRGHAATSGAAARGTTTSSTSTAMTETAVQFPGQSVNRTHVASQVTKGVLGIVARGDRGRVVLRTGVVILGISHPGDRVMERITREDWRAQETHHSDQRAKTRRETPDCETHGHSLSVDHSQESSLRCSNRRKHEA